MADSVWYYARGDVEKGPVTPPQMKALVAAGKVRRDDYVWKEGMESWKPAGELTDLFPGGPQADETPVPQDAPSRESDSGERRIRRRAVARPVTGTVDTMRPLSLALLLLGFVLALMSRGCDTLSRRNVSRLEAISEVARRNFDLKAERQLVALRPDERQKADAINKQRRDELEESLWREYDRDAESAELNYRLWAYWRELTFFMGTVALATGLFGIGFSNAGPERWVCFALLGVILYSLYVSNGVWRDVGP